MIPSKDDEPEIAALTIEQVAEALQVSTRTVQRRIAAGHIRVVPIGRPIRISISEFERLLSGA